MARVAYVAPNIAEPAELVDAIRTRRGGALLNLDRMLLNSPPLAAGWNTFMGAVRSNLTLEPVLRELAMCVVAVLNGARYEFDQHAPLFVQAGGTTDQVAALADPVAACDDVHRFTPPQRATLRLTVEMTRSVAVTDATFEAVRQVLGERASVELVAVIAAYNMVSRFLVALAIDHEPA